jgi:hypothetical protein
MKYAQILNTIGLALGMIGVIIIFIFGPPQPTLEHGVSMGLEDSTPIDPTGKTVAEYNQEVEKRRRKHSVMSKLGLALIFLGFGFQIWATWLSPSALRTNPPPSSSNSPTPSTPFPHTPRPGVFWG